MTFADFFVFIVRMGLWSRNERADKRAMVPPRVVARLRRFLVARSSYALIIPPNLIAPQRVEDRLDAWDFVGAKQIGSAERGEHGKERFGAADLLAEILERVGQGVADRKTERAQPEAV